MTWHETTVHMCTNSRWANLVWLLTWTNVQYIIYIYIYIYSARGQVSPTTRLVIESYCGRFSVPSRCGDSKMALWFRSYLADDVLICESDNHPVLGGIVLVLLLDNKTATGIVISLSFAPPPELHLETLEVCLVFDNFHKPLQAETQTALLGGAGRLFQSANEILGIQKDLKAPTVSRPSWSTTRHAGQWRGTNLIEENYRHRHPDGSI